jgi:hypothetical protein
MELSETKRFTDALSSKEGTKKVGGGTERENYVIKFVLKILQEDSNIFCYNLLPIHSNCRVYVVSDGNCKIRVKPNVDKCKHILHVRFSHVFCDLVPWMNFRPTPCSPIQEHSIIETLAQIIS